MSATLGWGGVQMGSNKSNNLLNRRTDHRKWMVTQNGGIIRCLYFTLSYSRVYHLLEGAPAGHAGYDCFSTMDDPDIFKGLTTSQHRLDLLKTNNHVW